MFQKMQGSLDETETGKYLALCFKSKQYQFVVEIVKYCKLKAVDFASVLTIPKAKQQKLKVKLPKFKLNFKVKLLEMLNKIEVQKVISRE